jgi:hypothetical protein
LRIEATTKFASEAAFRRKALSLVESSRPFTADRTLPTACRFTPLSGRAARLYLQRATAPLPSATSSQPFIGQVIAPLLNGSGIEFVGEINESAKTEFLGQSAGLLFPIA